MSSDDFHIREARPEDLAALIGLFAADALGGHGDTLDEAARPHYERAFAAIMASPGDLLLVVEHAGEVVATAQLTFIHSLPGRGALKMAIEAVQTRADMRSKGIGARLVNHCLALGRERGAVHAQLTSNAKRVDAHKFYERLGFEKSHAGFKMKLAPAST
ncbi:GNAT family N-acetyltransferase [Phyllobacterium sp. 0TCS1.6C]|jgi:GNAT superfamily N-acetyltransferase|uniref:GNAT family N-acetyltransferase n=1 Tax=unclassified Phyllobacterium TaxID=2638441 RepID=UPI0022654637|nr:MULTISPECIES: GNAT family N-acetyltransferase [unclassified Phyllobacterium]MCX8282622.1 GNAT family N-acetyltransferase [Phyllobacterium sp. 0TCS1.6C]MCX8294682.1 GNAT family N-acetyltransferase [Phyllobacterium sp. 0TCS1.6A]